MRKIIAANHVTLDGIIQSGGGPEEDPRGDFTHGGWQVPFRSGMTAAGRGEVADSLSRSGSFAQPAGYGGEASAASRVTVPSNRV
jgi:hypothetical protein